MDFQLSLVLAVLFGASTLFAVDRFRMDFIGFGALTVLLLSGVLSVPEALAGFADPAVHMIAGLFVVGGAVFQTGLADRFGRRLEHLGAGSPRRLLVVITLAAASLSAFLSSTGTVALMVPVVTMLARRARVSPSKLMIPLAYATLLGGTLTLIGTPPNIVVSTALSEAGYGPFNFFSFTGPGLCLLALGVGFLVLFGQRLLPERIATQPSAATPTPEELWERYGLAGWVQELRVSPESPLVGATIGKSQVRSSYGVTIFGVRPGAALDEHAERANADCVLEAGQVIAVKGAPEAVDHFASEAKLSHVRRLTDLPQGIVAVELLVPPSSSLVGKAIAESRLRSRFDVTVLAVFRSREVLRESVARTTVFVGDLLLVMGTAKGLHRLRSETSDVIFVHEPEALKEPEFRTTKALPALLVLFAMLLAMTFELTSPVVAVVAAAFGMVLFGCLEPNEAEKAINWESVLLIATVIPLATALNKVGAIDIVVKGLVGSLGGAGPLVVSSALFLLAASISLFISNTATAVLLSPVAVQIAAGLELRPQPLLMTVAIAASAAFVTPVSSPVNMLVVNAGGYRFSDFPRIGLPLLVVVWLGTLLVVPLFFPFRE